MNSQYNRTCKPCETVQRQEAHDLQIIITYLYDTLDARQKGTETAEGTPAASSQESDPLRHDRAQGRRQHRQAEPHPERRDVS